MDEARVKILYDHQVFSYQRTGGVSRYFSQLALGPGSSAFEKRLSVRYSHNEYLEPSKVRAVLPRLQFKGKAHLQNFLNEIESVRALKNGDFQVFHPTYYDPYFLKCLGKKPFVVTVHDMIHELFPDTVSDAAKVRTNKKRLCEAAAKIIAVSQNTKNDLVEIDKIEAEKIVVVHHGNSLTPDLVALEEISQLKNKRFVLYVGQRQGYKNWETALEAFRRLKSSLPDVQFVCAGGGTFTSIEIERVRKSSFLESVVQVFPNDAELAWLYANAVCLFYTSRYEGFGFPLIEAESFGCPVVASNRSSLPEIASGETYLVDPDAVDDIVDIAKELCSNERRVRVVRDLTWAETIRKTEAVYAQIGK